MGSVMSTPIFRRSEGLLMAKNPSRRGTQKKQTEHWQSQRKSFITRHPAMTVDRHDIM